MADLGKVLSEATQYGDDRVTEATAELTAELVTLTGERDAARGALSAVEADLDACLATVQDTREQLGTRTGELALAKKAIADLDTQVQAKHEQLQAALAEIARLNQLLNPQPPAPVSMGMATEANKWAERVTVTGPVASRRIYEGSWNVADLVADAKMIHNQGLDPVVSLKVPPADWAAAGTGAYDARFKDLGQQLATLDYTVFATINHEPRGGTIDTPTELIPWSKMLTRAFPIIRAQLPATSKVMLGTIDNGHPWGIKWGHLTDTELAIYYPPALLASCDFLGGDFYDGATNTNPGEPAWIKMREFAAWATRVGFKGPLGVGEWNFITGKDCRDTWPILNTGRWAFACLFNSGENNRTDLPASLNGSWALVPGTDRAKAFREVLDLAIPGR